MTPLGTLIREARENAQPTPEELAARAGRGGAKVARGISAAELAARINAVRAPHEATMLPAAIHHAEKTGPREPTLAAICDALGLDVVLVPAAPAPQ